MSDTEGAFPSSQSGRLFPYLSTKTVLTEWLTQEFLSFLVSYRETQDTDFYFKISDLLTANSLSLSTKFSFRDNSVNRLQAELGVGGEHAEHV